uniref:Uncharacterized protein n=1 Tax=Anguilla anguilla TaxID=7936 RepID=A0A0E9QVA7_ANGAN
MALSVPPLWVSKLKGIWERFYLLFKQAHHNPYQTLQNM